MLITLRNNCDCPACRAAEAMSDFCERLRAENREATEAEEQQVHLWTRIILGGIDEDGGIDETGI